MAHEFELRQEIELAATPEQVWASIATGPGLDSWFMGRNEIEGAVGGSARMTLDGPPGPADEATVTAWEPPRRFANRTAEGDDGSFMAIEYLVEGRGQGSTVLRLVHSGVLGGDWETEYEAMQQGWPMYLDKLAKYLTHFPGRTATAVVSVVRPQAAGPEQAWAGFNRELGLSGPAAEGDAVLLAVEGLTPVEGVIDYVDPPTFLGVRTEDGLYRFIHSGADRGNVVVLGHHIFAPDVDPQKTQEAWQAWLARVVA